ncbi:MAG: DUF3887 domain-containing protein [Lachnotalea sp.]
MNKDKYVRAILKKLSCTGKKKKEIEKELISDIQIAMENGETWQEISIRMGTPVTIASEFNDNFSEAEIKAAKKIKLVKIIIIVLVFAAMIGIVTNWMSLKTSAIDSNSIFDEQAVIKQAEEIILLANSDDYDTIKDQYANSVLKPLFDGSKILEVKKQFSLDWGDFKSFGNAYTFENSQMGKHYAGIEMSALYDNISITYSLAFDKDMKLAAFYMK